MEVGLVEMMAMTLGSGAATGGVTVYGLRVHIQYLREQFARHLAEAEAQRTRLDALEKEAVRIEGYAMRAHARLDRLEGANV